MLVSELDPSLVGGHTLKVGERLKTGAQSGEVVADRRKAVSWALSVGELGSSRGVSTCLKVGDDAGNRGGHVEARAASCGAEVDSYSSHGAPVGGGAIRMRSGRRADDGQPASPRIRRFYCGCVVAEGTRVVRVGTARVEGLHELLEELEHFLLHAVGLGQSADAGLGENLVLGQIGSGLAVVGCGDGLLR